MDAFSATERSVWAIGRLLKIPLSARGQWKTIGFPLFISLDTMPIGPGVALDASVLLNPLTSGGARSDRV